jgi:hypothetical protein
MFKYPQKIGSPREPSGIFIGDEHAKLYHLVQLTASISELKINGVKVLFIEAFYADNPPVSIDVASLATYLKGRNFVHTETPVGIRELPVCYNSLLQRCKRANLPVLGVDVTTPPNLRPFKKIAWRSSGVNDEWKKNIEQQCLKNAWDKFALFGGRAHAKALSNRFGNRITTQIWEPTHKRYIDL